MRKIMLNIRSDFADEGDFLDDKEETFTHHECVEGDIKTNYIRILKEDNILNKEVGDYVSIEFSNLQDYRDRECIINHIIKNMKVMLEDMKLSNSKRYLVVGLGNRFITSDALGPGVIGEIMVTAHLYEMKIKEAMKGTSNVAALAPGVMGQTGLETCSIISCIVKQYKPDFVIVVDALATRNSKRINRVVQINNTGIQPGSGTGNQRMALNKQSLKCPVIAIGVATITSIGAILDETLESLKINSSEILQAIQERNALDLVVTPKSMDDELQHLIFIIARALNEVIHPDFLNL
ncbi:MAG: GPR endopeptidase [Erysipelotrichaceae bacterium]